MWHRLKLWCYRHLWRRRRFNCRHRWLCIRWNSFRRVRTARPHPQISGHEDSVAQIRLFPLSTVCTLLTHIAILLYLSQRSSIISGYPVYMEHKRFRIRFLEPAEKYLKSLSNAEQARVDADTNAMRNGDDSLVNTKRLKGPIHELIVGNHRITYFTLDTTIYFVRSFRKKSAKTPRNEIEYAEQVYKTLRQ